VNPIDLVLHGAPDWNPVRQGVTMLFRGMCLVALGLLLAAYAFYDVSTHWTLNGGSGHEGVAGVLLGAFAVISGAVTFIGAPLLALIGVFKLAGIPATPVGRRWASCGAAGVPVAIVALGLTGATLRPANFSRPAPTVQQAAAPLPENASLWDAMVGAPNTGAPPPEAPPLAKPRLILGLDAKVIALSAAIFVLVAALFHWTLCIIHLLRTAAHRWGARSLSRQFLIFFIVAWCISAVWGFFELDQEALEPITNTSFPFQTGSQILFTAAPIFVFGLVIWFLVMLRKLARQLNSSQTDAALGGAKA
jgi:hypothetical protein